MHKAELLQGKKTQESTEKLDARVAAHEIKRDSISDNSLFAEEKPKNSNRDKPAPNRRGDNYKHGLPGN